MSNSHPNLISKTGSCIWADNWKLDENLENLWREDVDFAWGGGHEIMNHWRPKDWVNYSPLTLNSSSLHTYVVPSQIEQGWFVDQLDITDKMLYDYFWGYVKKYIETSAFIFCITCSGRSYPTCYTDIEAALYTGPLVGSLNSNHHQLAGHLYN